MRWKAWNTVAQVRSLDKCGGQRDCVHIFSSVCGEGKEQRTADWKTVKRRCPTGAVNGSAREVSSRGEGKEQDLASEATSWEERARQTKPHTALTQQNKEKRCIMGVGAMRRRWRHAGWEHALSFPTLAQRRIQLLWKTAIFSFNKGYFVRLNTNIIRI